MPVCDCWQPQVAGGPADVVAQHSSFCSGSQQLVRASGSQHGEVAGADEPGLRARMIAEAACSWTRWVGVISMSSNPGGGEDRAELGLGERAGDAAGPGGHVGSGRSSMSGSAMTSEIGEAAAGAQDACGFGDRLGLVAGEVDDAVGDDDVDACVGEGHVLEVALDELDVARRRPRAALARARSSISSVMSMPIALPVGPTRRALMRTSAPAPEPRSSTVSPSRRSATAVGTPQPSEALDRGLGRLVASSVVEGAPNTSSPSAGVHPRRVAGPRAPTRPRRTSRGPSRGCPRASRSRAPAVLLRGAALGLVVGSQQLACARARSRRAPPVGVGRSAQPCG